LVYFFEKLRNESEGILKNCVAGYYYLAE